MYPIQFIDIRYIRDETSIVVVLVVSLTLKKSTQFYFLLLLPSFGTIQLTHFGIVGDKEDFHSKRFRRFS